MLVIHISFSEPVLIISFVHFLNGVFPFPPFEHSLYILGADPLFLTTILQIFSPMDFFFLKLTKASFNIDANCSHVVLFYMFCFLGHL